MGRSGRPLTVDEQTAFFADHWDTGSESPPFPILSSNDAPIALGIPSTAELPIGTFVQPTRTVLGMSDLGNRGSQSGTTKRMNHKSLTDAVEHLFPTENPFDWSLDGPSGKQKRKALKASPQIVKKPVQSKRIPAGGRKGKTSVSNDAPGAKTGPPTSLDVDLAVPPTRRYPPISIDDIFAPIPETPSPYVAKVQPLGNSPVTTMSPIITPARLTHTLCKSPLRGRTQYEVMFQALVKAENDCSVVEALEKDREEELGTHDRAYRATRLHRVIEAKHVLDQCTTQIMDLQKELDEKLDAHLIRSRIELAAMLAADKANDRNEERDARPEEAGPSSAQRPGKKRRTI